MSAAATAARPGAVTIVLGALAVAVVLVLLAELPPVVGLPAIGLLVVALGLVGLAAARGARAVGGPGAMTTVASVLWFWGVVTGLSHLVRSAVGDPTGLGSVGTGLLTTVVWAVLVWFLRRPAAR